MFFSKARKLITVFIFIYTFQSGADLYASQASSNISEPSPSEVYLSENRGFLSDYTFSLGTSILSKREDNYSSTKTKTDFLSGTLNVIIGKANWNYQELYMNLRLKKTGEKEEIFIFEVIPRAFYFFSVVGVKFYAGLGLGFGIQPYHIYSSSKNIGKIFSLGGQGFTGFKTPDIYNNFGFFMELHWTTLAFPFYSGSSVSSPTQPGASQQTASSPSLKEIEIDKDDPGENNFSLNLGITYHF